MANFILEGDGYDEYFDVLSRAQNALETIYPTTEAVTEMCWQAKQILMYLEDELGDAAANKADLGTFDFDGYTKLDFNTNKAADGYKENVSTAEYIRNAAIDLTNALSCNIDLQIFDDLIVELADGENNGTD